MEAGRLETDDANSRITIIIIRNIRHERGTSLSSYEAGNLEAGLEDNILFSKHSYFGLESCEVEG